MSDIHAAAEAPIIDGPTILSTDVEQTSLPAKTQRPTSKDYAAEIQRLELERLKLQSQPISFPVMSGTSLSLPPTRVETTGSLEIPQNGLLSQATSKSLQLSESRSTPELRFNLDSLRAEMRQDKEVVNSIQDQLSQRSEQISSVRSELKWNQTEEHIAAGSQGRQADHYSENVSEEQRMLADLRKQLQQQTKENARLKQQVPSSSSNLSYHRRQPNTSHIMTSTASTMAYTNSLPPTSGDSSLPQQSPPNLIIPASTQVHTGVSPNATHSPDATSQSLSPQSSFTSVSPLSSVLSGKRDESSTRETRVKTVSSRLPANLEGRRRSPADKSNELHLQKRLDQSQTQVSQLKDRLKECNDICEEQKIHFRDSIAELQARLKETVIGRNSVLDLRKKEAEGQEYLINQLQQVLKELEADYRLLQESSKESNFRIDTLQQNLSTTTAALNQINLMVSKDADNRGLTLFTAPSESLSANQRPALVVTSFQQLLRHSEDASKEVRQKAMNYGKELEDLKKEYGDYKLKASEEYRSKLNQLTEEHEKQMNTVTERALNARQQATGLQAQLAVLQEQTQHQVEGKSKHISQLEQTLVDLQQQMNESRRVLEDKCQSLNDELDGLTDHHRTVSKERDDLVSIVDGMEQEITEARVSLTKADADVDSEHIQSQHLQVTLEQSNQKCNDLMSQLKQRSSEVEELKRSLDEVKEVAQKQLHEKVSGVVTEERHRSSELTTQLSSQVASLTQKCTILSQELDQKENTIHNFKKHQDDAHRNTEDVNYQLQTVLSEKIEFVKQIEEKSRNAEIIKQERDHYFVLLEERNKEVTSLRSQQETLLVQIAERDRHVMAFREQTSNMTQLVEISSKSSDVIKEEKVHLQQQLEEKKLEVNSLKMTMEGIEGRLKMKGRKLKELEEENGRLMEEVDVKMKELEKIIETKEKMLTDLREAKLEVDAMAKDNERLRLEVVQNRRQYEKNQNKLSSKYRAVEYELAMTTKAVQTANTVDAKAVRVAESMQKKVTAKRGQIDSLQSKMHWLEECLDAALKEKSAVIGEKDRLELKLDKLNRQNQRLNTDVSSMMHKRKAQKSVVRKLELALEKAAVKHSEVQAYIEMQEQDMARFKLKHQLEIKELQRSSAVQNTITTKSHAGITKAYYPVPISSMIPSISNSTPAHVAMETKTQAVQTNSTRSETGTKMLKDYAEKELSLSQALTKAATTPNSSIEVNQELKALLTEMKNVLASAKQQSGTPPSSSGVSSMPSGLDPPIYASSPYNSNSATASKTQHTTDISGPLTAYTPTKLTMDGPPSPVANLLGRYNRDQSVSVSEREDGSSRDIQKTRFTGVKMASAYQTKRTRHRRVSGGTNGQVTEVSSEEDVTSITSITTPDLDSSMETQKHHIQQLEEQLKVLSKIGGQLQNENKEMATLIKSQDTKLKKCRKEERTIQSLVSTSKR